jgi:hypothetical protein
MWEFSCGVRKQKVLYKRPPNSKRKRLTLIVAVILV